MSEINDDQKAKERQMRNDLIGAIFTLIVRLVGESIKDKLVRSLFVGAVGAASAYYGIPQPDVHIEEAAPPITIQQHNGQPIPLPSTPLIPSINKGP